MTTDDSLDLDAGTPEARIYGLYQYGFWTGLALSVVAVTAASVLYAVASWGVVFTAGVGVAVAFALVLPARLVRLRGLSGTSGAEWLAVVLTVAGVLALFAGLQWLLP
jgi:hypothetical protein